LARPEYRPLALFRSAYSLVKKHPWRTPEARCLFGISVHSRFWRIKGMGGIRRCWGVTGVSRHLNREAAAPAALLRPRRHVRRYDGREYCHAQMRDDLHWCALSAGEIHHGLRTDEAADALFTLALWAGLADAGDSVVPDVALPALSSLQVALGRITRL